MTLGLQNFSGILIYFLLFYPCEFSQLLDPCPVPLPPPQDIALDPALLAFIVFYFYLHIT